MKTITEILGGAQTLLPIEYPLQECFPEYLSNNQKLFLAILQKIESSITIPEVHSNKGRPSYPNINFFVLFLHSLFSN